MTDREVVLERYKDAVCDYLGGYFRVWKDRNKAPMALGSALGCEDDAWADAAQAIKGRYYAGKLDAEN